MYQNDYHIEKKNGMNLCVMHFSVVNDLQKLTISDCCGMTQKKNAGSICGDRQAGNRKREVLCD